MNGLENYYDTRPEELERDKQLLQDSTHQDPVTNQDRMEYRNVYFDDNGVMHPLSQLLDNNSQTGETE